MTSWIWRIRCFITPIFSITCCIRLFLMTRVQLLSNDPPQGHLRSHGSDSFLPITFDRMEIKKWKWHKCVCLVKTHWPVCNMTYLGHIGSPRDLDRSNFENKLLRFLILRMASKMESAWNFRQEIMFQCHKHTTESSYKSKKNMNQ